MAEQVRLYAATKDGLAVLRSTRTGWEQVGMPLPGLVSESFAGSSRHPERVYVAVMGEGLFSTDDAGAHWTRMWEGDARAVAVDPMNEDVLYVGSEPVHLFRSEDRGDSWEELEALQDFPDEVRIGWWGPQPPHEGHVANIFIHPDDTNTIYLCLEHGGVVRSFDRGATWEDVSKGIDYLDMHILQTLPGSKTRYYVSSARKFFTSDDPGQGWHAAHNGLDRDYFHDFIFMPPEHAGGEPTMLMATADKSPGYWDRPDRARTAFFRSDDGAQSWRRVGLDLPDIMETWAYTLIQDPNNPNGAFAGLGDQVRGQHGKAHYGEGGIIATRDRGDSWETLPVQVSATYALWGAPDQ